MPSRRLAACRAAACPSARRRHQRPVPVERKFRIDQVAVILDQVASGGLRRFLIAREDDYEITGRNKMLSLQTQEGLGEERDLSP